MNGIVFYVNCDVCALAFIFVHSVVHRHNIIAEVSDGPYVYHRERGRHTLSVRPNTMESRHSLRTSNSEYNIAHWVVLRAALIACVWQATNGWWLWPMCMSPVSERVCVCVNLFDHIVRLHNLYGKRRCIVEKAKKINCVFCLSVSPPLSFCNSRLQYRMYFTFSWHNLCVSFSFAARVRFILCALLSFRLCAVLPLCITYTRSCKHWIHYYFDCMFHIHQHFWLRDEDGPFSTRARDWTLLARSPRWNDGHFGWFWSYARRHEWSDKSS